ncbi:hypothetical protein [Desulfatibacillum aliphaticivorans]|uniref:hypothetical protein n=1 Tax=Desulfatibacillum aliphaticivorans TaxID=218208 RepID=UPI00041D9048|nr:hypothetical protein [Desulfatibacillum aliphaticivorans]
MQTRSFEALSTPHILEKELEAIELVDRYKVENQFRASKSSSHVRVNPIFHWTDSKIRCHLLTCLLALTCRRLLLTPPEACICFWQFGRQAGNKLTWCVICISFVRMYNVCIADACLRGGFFYLTIQFSYRLRARQGGGRPTGKTGPNC